jgi:Kef-type K+ transport system membrane component KefB
VAVVISNVSIVIPFALGALAALALYKDHAPAGIPLQAFALFMGIAMSITAFPVLARILAERNMADTPVGAMALTCAAVGDVTAWILLAFVVAVVSAGGSLANVVTMVAMTAGFVAAMILVIRPILGPFFRTRPGQDAFSRERIAVAVGAALASALTTEVIGIHALFGAFVAGATLPAGDEFRAGLRDRLESFSSVLLLPLFFAFTGLRTQIGLIDSWSAVFLCLAMIALATVGKLGGGALAARVMGMNWKDSFILGALMNTRGLMELIALNVGYDLGVISPQMFTVLVVMALVTTAMTGPLVDLVKRRLSS